MASRTQQWQSLPSVNLVPLWLLACGSAIALFWLIRELLKLAMAFTNDLLVKLPYLEPFQPFYHDPTQTIILMLALLLCLSPWLLDALLKLFDNCQPLTSEALSTYSPAARRLLQHYYQQRGCALPQLRILPTSAPLALTYGNLPRTARIVVSQGLLQQLTDDEIATVYATQLGHIAHWDFVVMSLFMVVTQLPYTVYRQVSLWGNQASNATLRAIAATFASCAYGLWYLLSVPALWLSQLRIYYSDRFAANMTGHPNSLTRALLKIVQGITQDIQQQGHTSWLLESWNLLNCVSYQQAITIGSLDSDSQLESVLLWDCLNLHRYWLTINNTHPLIGDRCQRLSHIAHQWRLETELNLLKTPESGDNVFNSKLKTQNSKLCLQAAPFIGIFLGLAFGSLMWLIGGIGSLLGMAQLTWMYGDQSLIQGCLLIGYSIGTLVRINFFFPDIKPTTVLTDPSFPQLLANPNTLPVDSQPVRIQGKLLGRHGISNWLGQDLILHSSTAGLVKLHHISRLGWIGEFVFRHSPSPTDLLDRHLIVTGWFRRGATLWIDVELLRTQGGKISPSGHPIWSTLLATVAAASGVYLILTGGVGK